MTILKIEDVKNGLSDEYSKENSEEFGPSEDSEWEESEEEYGSEEDDEEEEDSEEPSEEDDSEDSVSEEVEDDGNEDDSKDDAKEEKSEEEKKAEEPKNVRPSPGGLTSLTKHTKTEGCRTKEERANPESLLNHKKKHSKQRRQKIKKKNVNVSEEHLRDDILEGIKFQTLVLEEAMQKKESSKSNNHWGRFLVGRQETILEMDELMKDCMIESQERNIDESVVQQQLDEIQQKIISMLKRKASCLEMEKDSLAQEMVGWKMRIQRSGEIAMKKMLEWEEHLELDIDTADIEALQRLDQMLVLSQEQQTQLQTQRNRASTAEKDIDLLNGFVSNLHGEQSLMSVELDVISNECQKQQKENSLLKRQLSESAATFAQNEKKLEQDICSLKSKNETASSDLIKAKGWVATLNRELEELREQAAREAENSQNLIEQLREDKRTLENVREQTYALEEAMRKYQTRSGWGFFGRQKEEDLLDMDELMKDAVLQSK